MRHSEEKLSVIRLGQNFHAVICEVWHETKTLKIGYEKNFLRLDGKIFFSETRKVFKRDNGQIDKFSERGGLNVGKDNDARKIYTSAAQCLNVIRYVTRHNLKA